MDNILSSTGFKSIGLSLIIHGSSFSYTNLVAKELLKLNNTINTCLISLSIILYYSVNV